MAQEALFWVAEHHLLVASIGGVHLRFGDVCFGQKERDLE